MARTKQKNTINLDEIRKIENEKKQEEQRLNEGAEYYESIINAITGFYLSEEGKNKVKKWLKKYGVDELTNALEISFERYYVNIYDEDSKSDAFNKAFLMIPRIAENKRRVDKNPVLKEVYYLRKILINRLYYVNQWQARAMLENMLNVYPELLEDIKNFCCQCDNWGEFKEYYNTLMHTIEI